MKTKLNEGKRTRAAARKTRRSSLKAQLPAPSITVTFRHLEPTEAIRSYAERKLGRATRFLKRACSVHLILSVDKYRHYGEVTLKSGHLTIAAQEETQDLYAVIDGLTDKVGHQLRSFHGRVETRKVRGLSASEVMAVAEER
jgi:ribosomal subunit interface protein